MIGMVDVVHETIDDEQAEMHIWPPADFCGFDLEHAVPIECKCRTMVEWSQFIKFFSFRVHWHGSLWINVFKRSFSNPEGLPERGVSLMSKLSSLKRENHFIVMLSPMALSPYIVQMFLAASTAFAPLSNSNRRCEEIFQFLHLALLFLASAAPLTIFKWQNFNM